MKVILLVNEDCQHMFLLRKYLKDLDLKYTVKINEENPVLQRLRKFIFCLVYNWIVKKNK